MEVIQGDCLEILKTLSPHSIDSLVTDPPAGISFMGKAWDDDKGGRKQWIAWMTEVMTECLRVMKPGAHGLVWALPRTSHWTATALEDAGFEVRDVVMHLFGSGFPKSLDISKAIDKHAGAEREIIDTIKKTPSAHSENMHEGYRRPRAKDHPKTMDITAPPTPEAKQWFGWGTALKPASEHWILIRKPCSEKTVAANVLKHGTGGINVDASRIGVSATDPNKRRDTGGYASIETRAITQNAPYNSTRGATLTTGRFPANLVLSHSEHCDDTQCDIECAIKRLDEQSGSRPPGYRKNASTQSGSNFQSNLGAGERGYKDTGGASRFFYCAKASKSDKGKDNNHCTVKATKLMSYLIRMITPPNGVVLDPFMGSGSTGVAAKECGFGFIGIEKEKEYAEIALRRMS